MTGIVLCGLAWPDSVGFLAPFSLMGLVASFSFACLVLYVYTPPHAWLWMWSAGHDGAVSPQTSQCNSSQKQYL